MSQLTRCDSCNAVAEQGYPWINLTTYKLRRPTLADPDPGSYHYGGDFCSIECVNAYMSSWSDVFAARPVAASLGLS